MFIANLNVFIALMAGTSYLLAWFLGIPFSMVVIPHTISLVVFDALLLGVALIIIFIWSRRGLVQSIFEPVYGKVYRAGHWVVAIANFVLIGGVGLFLRAASTSKEDEYWFGLMMTDFIGPVGCVLATAGLAMVLLTPLRRNGGQSP